MTAPVSGAPPRVAYVASRLPMTFVIGEMESHARAGWEILPVASAAPVDPRHLSQLERSWQGRTIHRPGVLEQAIALTVTALRRPRAALRVATWLVRLTLASPTELPYALYEIGAACYFAARCRAFGVQRLHVHFASRSLDLGLLLGILLDDAPVTCTAHAYDIFTRGGASLRFRLRQCAAVVAISDFNREYLRQKCGDDVWRRTTVVRCGVDPARFRPSAAVRRPGRLLSVTRLDAKKGLDVALRACALLHGRGLAVSLTVAGDGEERSRLARLAHGEHLDRHVEFLGVVPNDVLPRLLAEATIFVLPCVTLPNGDRDGIPVALMEAMAAGVPVVSTGISGIPELIEDRVSGLLVPQRDAVALADAIQELMTDRGLAKRLAAAGRAVIEASYTAEYNAARLREVLLCDRSLGPRRPLKARSGAATGP